MSIPIDGRVEPGSPTPADQSNSHGGRIAFDHPVDVALAWKMRTSTLDLVIDGEVCAWAVLQLRAVLVDLLAIFRPAEVIIDCSRVTFADARAASMLVQVKRLTTTNAAALRLPAPSAPLLRILELGGLKNEFDTTALRPT